MQAAARPQAEQLGVAEEVAGHQRGARAEGHLNDTLARLEHDNLVARGAVGLEDLRHAARGDADRVVVVQRLPTIKTIEMHVHDAWIHVIMVPMERINKSKPPVPSWRTCVMHR